MSVRKARTSNVFNSRFEPLEPRVLLAGFANIPISISSDFVGTTSSVGPDGYSDIGLNLNGLQNKTVTYIRVNAITTAGNLFACK